MRSCNQRRDLRQFSPALTVYPALFNYRAQVLRKARPRAWSRMYSALSHDGLGIEGIVFGEVHHRVAAMNAFEGERVDEFRARVRTSRSFLGDQPSRQRKLMKASGRNPASR